MKESNIQDKLSKNEFIVKVNLKKAETEIMIKGRKAKSIDKEALRILHGLLLTGAINGGALKHK